MRKRIGLSWKGKHFIHGPRKSSPSKYVGFRLGKRLPYGTRLVFGKTKNGKLELQSKLTPLKLRRKDGPRQTYHVLRNYGSKFHGTSEDRLVKMGLTGGLQPRGGKVYLSDDFKYARLKAREAAQETGFKPVVIEVDDPSDLRSEGRHFFTQQPIGMRSFKKVSVL